MKTKAQVRKYASDHPGATIREIQSALGISSPSVVHFHLNKMTHADRVQMLRDALKACSKQLAHCLGPDTEAGRMAKRALDATK